MALEIASPGPGLQTLLQHRDRLQALSIIVTIDSTKHSLVFTGGAPMLETLDLDI